MSLSTLSTNAWVSFVTNIPVYTEPRPFAWPGVLRGRFTAVPLVENALAQQVLVADLSAVDRQGPGYASCTPLMMAKKSKQGKKMGKVGRVDSIERWVGLSKDDPNYM